MNPGPQEMVGVNVLPQKGPVLVKNEKKWIILIQDFESFATYSWSLFDANSSLLLVSVTRFDEISPLWHNFKSLGQIFEGFLVFG